MRASSLHADVKNFGRRLNFENQTDVAKFEKLI